MTSGPRCFPSHSEWLDRERPGGIDEVQLRLKPPDGSAIWLDVEKRAVSGGKVVSKGQRDEEG